MVNRGWGHGDLSAMDEAEFVSVLEDQIALDEARADAEREAIKKAAR